MDITWRDFNVGGRKEWGEKVQVRRSIISRHKIDGERLKNGIGNRVLKELICTTHGHELRVGGMLEGWGDRMEGA